MVVGWLEGSADREIEAGCKPGAGRLRPTRREPAIVRAEVVAENV